MSQSKGEKAFAQVFQFKSNVQAEDQEPLRDFLYKFAHNIKEAKDNLQLLKQVNAINRNKKTELLFKIHHMALQTFSLTIRRMTDRTGERSAQRFINKIITNEYQESERSKIVKINAHYKEYIDKGVAHQDEVGIVDNLGAFPSTKIVNEDMKYLESFYNKITNDLCTSYARIDRKPHDYRDELKKLEKN